MMCVAYNILKAFFSFIALEDIPLSNDLITFDTLPSFKGTLPSTKHYILAGFCKKGFRILKTSALNVNLPYRV